jgi:hypothetical protein
MGLDVQTEVRCRIDDPSHTHGSCSDAIEQTGRPEQIKYKLPRLPNPFGKKNTKAEWKEATIWELIPELVPKTKSTSATRSGGPVSEAASLMAVKPLPPVPQG